MVLVGPALAAHSRLLASATISRAHGGYLRAHDGAALYVPPGTLKERRARATITAIRPHEFAITIHGPWKGRVRVTLPKAGGRYHPLVLHEINGSWVLESRGLGEMTVWVTHLSDFFSGVLKACDGALVEGPEAYATCLAIGSAAVVVAVGAVEGISYLVTPAPPSAPSPPGGSAGTLPAQGGPIQGSSPSLQGGPPPSQEATPPSPPPAPPSPSPSFYVYRVYGTCADGHCGLTVRSGPGYSSYASLGAMNEGAEVDVVCQTAGEDVGPSPATGASSTIWDEITSGGWVSDLYLTTPNVGTWSPPIPRC
jgi:hypothetical protein